MKSLFQRISQWYHNSAIGFWVHRILIIVFIVFLVIGVFKFLPSPKYHNSSTSNIATPVSTYKDKEGVTHSEIKADVVDKATFERVTDSFRRLLKNKGALQTVTQYIEKTDTVFVAQKVNIDTSTGDFSSEYKDNYISLTNYANYKTKEASFRLIEIDTITSVTYNRKHLFRANETIVNLSCKNPYNQIVEGSSVTIKQPKDRIVFTVGAVYNPFSQKVQVGIGVGFKVFSIKSK